MGVMDEEKGDSREEVGVMEAGGGGLEVCGVKQEAGSRVRVKHIEQGSYRQ